MGSWLTLTPELELAAVVEETADSETVPFAIEVAMEVVKDVRRAELVAETFTVVVREILLVEFCDSRAAANRP